MNGHDLYLITGAAVALTGFGFYIWSRRQDRRARRSKASAKWNLFFDMQHPEKKRIHLGVFEGSMSDAIEAAYHEQISFAFTYMNNHRDPNMAVMGNYGIEEIKDEHPANG